MTQEAEFDPAGYAANAANLAGGWDPDPYVEHPNGPYHERVFQDVVREVRELLERYDAGLVTESHLLRGKDNNARPDDTGRPARENTLAYWLYHQHHPTSERWKLLGQRYWSVKAWLSWRDKFKQIPHTQQRSRRDGLPSVATLPKWRRDGDAALVSEHVIPKKVLKRLLLHERNEAEKWLARNLCCVVTREEDRHLPRDRHPDPSKPWLRYVGCGIVLLHNSQWSDEETSTLFQHGLLTRASFQPLNGAAAKQPGILCSLT